MSISDIEDRQAKLESSATLGMIVAEVLHEGRPPTAFLAASSRSLARDWNRILKIPRDETLVSDAKDTLEMMESEAKRLERLFRLLSPLSGRRRGPPANFSVSKVIKGVLELLESKVSELGVSVTGNYKSFQGLSLGYGDDLTTAIANLVDNSLFWFEHLGKDSPKIHIECHQTAAGAVVDVVDNGPGISTSLEDRLFEPGFSTKPGGLGLGLSITREALRRSGATIENLAMESGCAFRIVLREPK